METAFHAFVWCHIATGTVGLLAFWLPVLGRKGGAVHRRAGLIFLTSMLTTGSFAILISSSTLLAPIETHPHLADRGAVWIRGIFGWMMLYLAVLTINLAWYGWSCIRNRAHHALHHRPLNLVLQVLVTAAALNCAIRGALIGEPLMMGISIIGLATGATNSFFMFKPRRGPMDWLKEHLKGLVGAGISVYTAFFAFGAVRLLPEAALNPMLWAAPCITGLAIIFYHWWAIDRRRSPRREAAIQAAE